MKDRRVAPNIFQTFRADGSVLGWRVYVKRDGVLQPRRFKADVTLEQLQIYVDTFKEETDRLHEERRAADVASKGSFAGDATRYLALKAVKAMPSYSDRKFQIERWTKVFRSRPRASITAREIDEQLHAFLDGGLSGSTVNKLRTALMSMWTRLDGKAAANPVRETTVFEEAEQEARGQPYALLKRILEAIPDRARPVKGVKGVRPSPSRARIAIILWTGMTPGQVGDLDPAKHFSIAQKWYTSPPRRKGHKRPRFPRPLVRKPMTADAQAAFRKFVAIKAYGKFDRRGLRHVWLRALARVEKQIQKERKDPKFKLPRIRLYDIRHSFGTELFKRTKNLGLVGEMLDQTSPRTTRRYAIGAVSGVLKSAMRSFERATGRRRR